VNYLTTEYIFEAICRLNLINFSTLLASMLNYINKPSRFSRQLKTSCNFLLISFSALFINICSAQAINISLVTEHYPPYQIVDDKNQLSGFTVELMNEVMERSQYQYSMEAYPWTVAYNFALQKPNHCVFSIARLSSRESSLKWIGKTIENNKAIVWGLKNKQHYKINSLEDIKRFNVAVKRSNAPHQALLERGFIEGQNLYVIDNANALINILQTRSEIDFIIADDITLIYRAKLAGVDINSLHKVYEINDFWSDFYLACNKDTNDEVIDKLTNILEEVHKDGTYQRLLGKLKG